MADPISLGIAATGTIISAYGKYSEGQAKAGMYGYQSGIAQLNKQIALQNAEYAIRSGETEARRSGMQTRFDVGRIKTAQGASNLDVNAGSGVDVRDSRSTIGRMDMSQIRENAGRRAYGFHVEAEQEEAKSKMYESAASGVKKAGMIGAIGSLVSGAASVSSKWMQWQSMSGGSDSLYMPDGT